MHGGQREEMKYLVPSLLYACLSGVLTGALIFVFKWAASAVVTSSDFLYQLARENTLNTILLLFGVAVLACVSYYIITKVPACCGLDVNAAVSYISARASFNRLMNIIVLFLSSLVTFFSGIPLGSEGPSIQMGCAVGHGAAQNLSKRNPALSAYMITGGACAGFCGATGAIFSGVLFAVEEVYRRVSPMILLTGVTAAVSSAATVELFCTLTGRQRTLFDVSVEQMLPVRYLWAALAVGAIVGLLAVGFTYLRRLVWRFLHGLIGKIPKLIVMILLFMIAGGLGIHSENFVGSGHHLIDELLEGHHFYWYILLLYLGVRLLLVSFSTQLGISGGLFIPFLAFGALAGGILSEVLSDLSLLPSGYQGILVLIGMMAFLAAVSKIPLTAIVFSIEAVCGISGALPIALGVGIAYLITLLWRRLTSFFSQEGRTAGNTQ